MWGWERDSGIFWPHSFIFCFLFVYEYEFSLSFALVIARKSRKVTSSLSPETWSRLFATRINSMPCLLAGGIVEKKDKHVHSKT